MSDHCPKCTVDCWVKYTLTCAECHAETIQAYRAHAGEQVPMPRLPYSWSEAEGRIYCHRHIVEVTYKVYPA